VDNRGGSSVTPHTGGARRKGIKGRRYR